MFSSRRRYKSKITGGFMSGDIGLSDTIIFYSSEMTRTKLILLEHKGIKLDYSKLNKTEKKVNKSIDGI